MPTTLAVSPPALLLLTPADLAAIAEATQADVSDDEITRIAEERAAGPSGCSLSWATALRAHGNTPRVPRSPTA